MATPWIPSQGLHKNPPNFVQNANAQGKTYIAISRNYVSSMYSHNVISSNCDFLGQEYTYLALNFIYICYRRFVSFLRGHPFGNDTKSFLITMT